MSRDTLMPEQIEETFRILGLDSEETRRRFVEMQPCPEEQRASAGYKVTTTDNTKCGGNDAELERDSERDKGVWQPA